MKKILIFSMAVLLLASCGKNAEMYFNTGEKYRGNGDYDKAIEQYAKAIKIKSDYIDAYTARAAAYWGKGQYDEAIEDFTFLLNLESNEQTQYLGGFYYQNYLDRGRLYYQKGDYAKAIADYNKANELYKNESLPFYYMANVYIDTGEYDKAIDDCSTAIRLNNNSGWWLYNSRAIAYYLKGELDPAISDFIVSIRLNKENNKEKEEAKENLKLAMKSRYGAVLTHIASDNLRLRARDNIESDVIMTIPEGTMVYITDTGRDDIIESMRGNWVYVTTESRDTGWCFDWYLDDILEY
jgi:tetratricopeptide (TPR) repeat protein